MIVNVKMICKQYGIPQGVHSLNVPLLCFKNWPEDGSVNRNITKFTVLITDICCVTD